MKNVNGYSDSGKSNVKNKDEITVRMVIPLQQGPSARLHQESNRRKHFLRMHGGDGGRDATKLLPEIADLHKKGGGYKPVTSAGGGAGRAGSE